LLFGVVILVDVDVVIGVSAFHFVQVVRGLRLKGSFV